MTVRSRRSLILPNAIRRAMAYPRGAGRHAITGYPAAAGIPPGGGVPLVLDALTYDPITYEMLGVKTGIGGLTIARGSERYVLDHEGVYRLVPANEPAWNGGRDVQALLRYSEDLSNAAWVKNNTTVDGEEVTFSAANCSVNQYPTSSTFSGSAGAPIYLTLTPEYKAYTVATTHEGRSFVARVKLKAGTTNKCTINIYCSTTAGPGFVILENGDYAGHTIFVNEAQFEESTGRADLTTPSEYCPTDTIGPGDPSGYKVFANQNGNSVIDNVVTEGVGAALAEVPWLSSCPAATNVLIQNRDLTTWSTQTASVAHNQVGIDGIPNKAFTLTDNSAAQTQYVSESIAGLLDNTVNSVVCWFKKTQGDAHYKAFTMFHGGGGASFMAGVFIDTNNGLLVDRDGAIPLESAIVSDGDFWKVGISADNGATGNTSITPAIHPAANTDFSGVLDPSATGAASGDVPALFFDTPLAAAMGIPPIITEGTAVSIQADAPTLDALNHNNDEVCYYFEWSPGYNYDEVTESLRLLTTRAAGVGQVYDSPVAGRFLTYDGTSFGQVSGITYAAQDTLKFGLAASLSDNEMYLCVNGTWSTVQPYDGYTVDTALELITGNLPMRMRNLQRYALLGSDAQKAKIDELMN